MFMKRKWDDGENKRGRQIKGFVRQRFCLVKRCEGVRDERGCERRLIIKRRWDRGDFGREKIGDDF